MSPAKFRWGVLFILVGGLLLLNNLEALDWWVWNDILSLWPLILIAIGVEKIFTRSKAQVVAYLAPLALAGVVIWVAFDGFSGDVFRVSSRGDDYTYELTMDPDIERVRAVLDVGDNDVDLGTTESKQFRVRSRGWSGLPKVEFQDADGVAELEVTPKRSRWRNWVNIGHRRGTNWNMFLTDNIPVTLTCYGDDAKMLLDCRKMQLEELIVDSRNGDIRIRIGDRLDTVAVKLDGRGDYRVLVPQGSGVRVSGGNPDLKQLFQRIGLNESGQYFMTAGYDTLTPRIDLTLSTGLTQFSLEYK